MFIIQSCIFYNPYLYSHAYYYKFQRVVNLKQIWIKIHWYRSWCPDGRSSLSLYAYVSVNSLAYTSTTHFPYSLIVTVYSRPIDIRVFAVYAELASCGSYIYIQRILFCYNYSITFHTGISCLPRGKQLSVFSGYT